MTEKLYYNNAYIKDFFATVLSCSSTDVGYSVVLDKTAFFPEEGGQSADTGTLGGIRVIDVSEKRGIIYHFLEAPLTVGDVVHGEIDFDERFDKMQQHTAEHILSGIIHSKYGFNNVGFHLGKDEVTFDIDGILTRAELDAVEDIANKAVFNNLNVRAYFPDPDELSSLKYRSKLDLSSGVRIVDIDGIDVCACCAPHVSRTGEIGCIKILDYVKWHSGLRMTIAAGARALMDYREKYTSVKNISTLLSAPKSDVYSAVSLLLSSNEEQRAAVRQLNFRIAALEAEKVESTEKNAVIAFQSMPTDALIEFSNHALPKIGGILVALSGTDGNYKYVISSNNEDISEKAKEINSALDGKGGGKGNMIRGSFASDIESIRKFFM